MFGRLSAYLDGELPRDLCRNIQRHLAGCRNCEAFLNTLRKTVDLCRKQPRPRLPARLRREVLRLVRHEAGVPPRPSPR